MFAEPLLQALREAYNASDIIFTLKTKVLQLLSIASKTCQVNFFKLKVAEQTTSPGFSK